MSQFCPVRKSALVSEVERLFMCNVIYEECPVFMKFSE